MLPESDAVPPPDDLAVTVRTDPPTVRFERSIVTTSGRPKAEATWACVRVKVHAANGL